MDPENDLELREWHLAGCAGKANIQIEDGIEYIVVPVVALMEGVIHAVNADTPEFVPFETLNEAAASWNGKPVTLGHPVKNGRQCSAQTTDILESHGIGKIRNSRMKGLQMLQEAWIVRDRVRKLHPEMHDRLLEAKGEEVSVGAFVMTAEENGNHRGKHYKRKWLKTAGDHLAFLPGGRGACSMEMGCGAYRAASHTINDAGLYTLETQVKLEALLDFVAAAGARHSKGDVEMLQTIHDHAMSLGATCDRKNYKLLSADEPRLKQPRVVAVREIST